MELVNSLPLSELERTTVKLLIDHNRLSPTSFGTTPVEDLVRQLRSEINKYEKAGSSEEVKALLDSLSLSDKDLFYVNHLIQLRRLKPKMFYFVPEGILYEILKYAIKENDAAGNLPPYIPTSENVLLDEHWHSTPTVGQTLRKRRVTQKDSP